MIQGRLNFDSPRPPRPAAGVTADRTPTHMIAAVGDRRSICGQRDDREAPSPYVLACWAAMHVAGCGRHSCPACLHAWVRTEEGAS
jgi:hypothetical protein